MAEQLRADRSERATTRPNSWPSELFGTLPMIWGSSDLAGIAAYRLLCQLAENAKYPAVNGVLPEALHNQVVTFTRPALVRAPDSTRPAARHGRAVAGGDRCRRGGDAGERVGRERSAVCTAVGHHPLERMASLCAVGDFASVYLGLLVGVDPTPDSPRSRS